MSDALCFCCSVNRNHVRVEHHYQPHPFTKTDRDHHLYTSCCQAVQTLLYAENLYAIHHQFCHTALLRNIFCGQDPSASLLASLWDCMLFRLLTSDPGSLVARPSRKPYTTKVVFWANFFHQFLTLCLAVKPYRPVFWCGRCDLLLYCMERQWCA